MSKKIINDPHDVVSEMLSGMSKANDNLVVKVDDYNILVRKSKKESKVSLISGGGSGHEPAHAGYVGPGMLDAAVAGPVFTSPNPKSILRAIKEVETDKGVLLIIKNYSGDVMNFKMAADKAEEEGINCDFVVVNDDVAIEDPEDRRGIAGTVFVHKIAGAAADLNYNLKEVKDIANKAIASVYSEGVALAPCFDPISKEPSFEIGSKEMEFGLGIHGEPGIEVKKLMDSKNISKLLLQDILDAADPDHGNEFAVMINSLGSTTLMEINIVANDISDLMKEKGLQIFDFYNGHFMTSMEMKGISLSLLVLNKEIKNLLKHPVNVSVKF